MAEHTADRRRFLRGVGTITALLAIAGCTENEDQPDDDPNGSPDDGDDSADGDDDIGSTDDDDGDGTGDDGTDDGGDGNGDDPGEDVSFDVDGRTVEGLLFGEGECGIVLAHDVDHEPRDWEEHADSLPTDEYTVLAIDLTDSAEAAADVAAAGAYLRTEHEVGTVIVVGAGAGADAVVESNAVADAGTIDGTVAISPLESSAYAEDIQGDLLVAVSEDDDEGVLDSATELVERAPNDAELLTFSGDAHGQDLLDSEDGDELLAELRGFVRAICSK